MSQVDIVIHRKVSVGLPPRSFFVRIINKVISKIGEQKDPVELGIVLMGPAGIRALNKKWRKIDTPTNMLAFPLHKNPQKRYSMISSGDIVLCPSVVRAYARRDKISFRNRMTWSVVHGLLHLAGYDHEKSAHAAARMNKKEQEILSTLWHTNPRSAV